MTAPVTMNRAQIQALVQKRLDDRDPFQKAAHFLMKTWDKPHDSVGGATLVDTVLNTNPVIATAQKILGTQDLIANGLKVATVGVVIVAAAGIYMYYKDRR